MRISRVAFGLTVAAVVIMAAAAAIVFAQSASAQQTAPQTASPAPIQKGTSMPLHAAGPFDVKLTPQDDKLDPTLGRMTIDKQFHGDLEATSKGQMLTAMSDVKGSAGYVAVERVMGMLHTPGGTRSGSFALLHRGIMTRGAPELSVTVVPDSGTGQLVGITGKMTINIVDGKHSYDFEYTLPD